MGATLIVKCTQCGGLMLVARDQKTKSCPYCGKQVKLLHAQRIATASTALEASEMLRKIKNEQKQNHK